MRNKRIFRLKEGCKTLSLLTAFCAILMLLAISGCEEHDKTYKESRTAMYTTCTITVLSRSPVKAKEAIDAGFAEIKRLESLLNYYSIDSEITAINNNAGKGPVKVSTETLDIIEKALAIAEATRGAFNPTIGPVMKLWESSRQDPEHPLPSGQIISETLKLVDYGKININKADSEIFLMDAGMEIDLGGIAKGYAADSAIGTIRASGIRSALVSIAGDIKGIGLKNENKPWRVGVQDPRSKSGSREEEYEIITTINLSDRAVSTSGDYQRFFLKDGKRYHHIIDPRTGYPTESRLISVSVMASEGYIADGLSTGIFILGPERGVDLLESMDLDGIIVDMDKKVYITENLREKIKILNEEYQIAE
jgi:thiamine biosynthesis lipoprotein